MKKSGRLTPPAVLLMSALVGSPVLIGQSAPEQSLTFDVASVKASPPPGMGSAFTTMEGGPGTKDPGRITYKNILLGNVITQAYGISYYTISGPCWLDDTRFDVVATIPSGATKEQFRFMLQALLRDRFQLVVHQEMRDIPGFSLVLAKGGPRLDEVGNQAPAEHLDANSLSEVASAPRRFDKDGFPITDPGPGVHQACIRGSCRWRGNHATIAQLGAILSNHFRCPIIDETNLKGTYSFILTYRVDTSNVSASPPKYEGNFPDIFHALQIQLGLALEGKKVPSSALVIDHIERVPREN